MYGAVATSRKAKKPTILKNCERKSTARSATPSRTRTRCDFYGNVITSKKRHAIFLDMSANRVYMVENFKAYNVMEQL